MIIRCRDCGCRREFDKIDNVAENHRTEMADRPLRRASSALAALLEQRDVADPYPGYAAWRMSQPVSQLDERLFVMSRYDDCLAVLTDTCFGHAESSRSRALSFLYLNPPDHTRLRGLVSRAFTPSRVCDLARRIEEIASRLIGAIAGKAEPSDLVSELASPLPVMVISQLLGIPAADHDQLLAWSDVLTLGVNLGFVMPEAERKVRQRARAEFASYLRGLVAQRRRTPGSDLLSALVHLHDRDGALTEDELVGICILILVAGHETTRSIIGAGALALLRHPTELARLRADPALTERATEEILRCEPPVQMTSRVALRDARVADVAIPVGSTVLLLIAAANRDPGFCDDPERFDVGREPGRHLTFSQGIHFCLGAPLARLEIQIALRSLAPVLGRLELAGEPTWAAGVALRVLRHLPVRPAARS
jgi:cytochrome P450